MGYNGNRFSVYDGEEKTVLELMLSAEKQINYNTDNKTELYGDHKGSWQGLNKPTLSEEGAHAQVEKNMEDIVLINGDLKTKANKINSKNLVNAVELGVKNDGSVAVDVQLQQLINDNKHVYLPSGTYLLNNPLSFRGGKIFECDGELKATISSSSAIRINDRNNTIYIKSIISENDGVTIGDIGYTDNADVYINNIDCKRIGFNFIPKTLGVQYSTFKFDYLKALDKCISIDTVGADSWVNQNKFYGGRVLGGIGVYARRSGLNSDYINGNTFWNFGFESLQTPVDMEDSRYNKFIEVRTAESIWSTGFWVSFGKSSKGNEFHTTSEFPLSKVFTDSNFINYFSGQLTDVPGGAQFAHDARVINGKYYTLGSQTGVVVNAYNQNANINRGHYQKYFRIGGDSGKEVYLRLNEEYGSNQGITEFFVEVTSSYNNINIVDPLGVLIVADKTKIISGHCYHFVRINDKWSCYDLGLKVN